MRLLLSIVWLTLAACSFERSEHAQACERDAQCSAGSRCLEGFCISDALTGGICQASSRLESCYEGEPASTMGVGACASGQRICVDGTYSECLGQVLPTVEVCNAKDDDCDGEIDDVESMGACDTRLQGACSEGALTCRDGVEVCQPAHESQPETCNGVDDDCDGAMDELGSAVCYPSGAEGCTRDAQGFWQCTGLCATGALACDGASERCGGAVVPRAEQCTELAAVAEDEDCDALIDESCDCPAGGAERDCYAGPVGTRDRGACRAGTQVCMGAGWGTCTGQVLPSPETCDNEGNDDDCNGEVDDVPGRGGSCVASGERGECRSGTLTCSSGSELECAPGEPGKEECDELDQDCDGDPTNGFDFASDATCGSCETQCSGAKTCCGGACIDEAALQDDVQNCGACGLECGEGQYCCQGDCLSVATKAMAACDCAMDCGARSCCGASCRDLEADEANCGACGRKCGRDETCVDGVCE